MNEGRKGEQRAECNRAGRGVYAPPERRAVRAVWHRGFGNHAGQPRLLRRDLEGVRGFRLPFFENRRAAVSSDAIQAELGIPSASFSDDAAVRFYEQWDALKRAPQTDANRAALDVLERYKAKTDHCAARLAHFAARCRQHPAAFYLTHGDAGGNFFVGNGRNYILDWDEVMYAPLERDAWVMGCYDWARRLFNDTLQANGIDDRLCPERLAFYCYHMFFFYLGEFLQVHPMQDKRQRIRAYFEDGWILSRIRFADTIA